MDLLRGLLAPTHLFSFGRILCSSLFHLVSLFYVFSGLWVFFTCLSILFYFSWTDTKGSFFFSFCLSLFSPSHSHFSALFLLFISIYVMQRPSSLRLSSPSRALSFSSSFLRSYFLFPWCSYSIFSTFVLFLSLLLRLALFPFPAAIFLSPFSSVSSLIFYIFVSSFLPGLPSILLLCFSINGSISHLRDILRFCIFISCSLICVPLLFYFNHHFTISSHLLSLCISHNIFPPKDVLACTINWSSHPPFAEFLCHAPSQLNEHGTTIYREGLASWLALQGSLPLLLVYSFLSPLTPFLSPPPPFICPGPLSVFCLVCWAPAFYRCPLLVS